MVKNGDLEDELEVLGNNIEKLEETFSHWKRWKWYYVFFGALGKTGVVIATYLLLGLTLNHFTGEEIFLENFTVVYVGPGGSTGPFSLDHISYMIPLDFGKEKLMRFRRFTDTEFRHVDEGDDKTVSLIHCKYEWEWYWKIPVPKSTVLICAKKSKIVIR
jgi:hypothetical protein